MGTINRMLTRREQASLLFVGAALILGVISIWWFGGNPAREPQAAATRADMTVRAESSIQVRPEKALPSNVSAVEHGATQETKPSSGEQENAPTAVVAGTPPIQQQVRTAAPAAVSADKPKDIAVAVRGGVIREGLYRLPPDSRVADLIEKAGGTRGGANLSMINLAAPLVDGTTLTIPLYPGAARERGTETPEELVSLTNPVNPTCYLITAQPDRASQTNVSGNGVNLERHEAGMQKAADPVSASASSGSSPEPKSGEKDRLNLNTATQAELEQLPGIGSKLAQQIILFRSQRPFTSVEDLDAVPGFGPKRIEAIRDLVTVQ